MNVGGGSAMTAIFRLAEADTPLESVKLTEKMFVPRSEFAGVPERRPLVATCNQAGPLDLA